MSKTSMMKLVEYCQQNLSGILVSLQEGGITENEKLHYKSSAKVLKDIINVGCDLVEDEKNQIEEAWFAGYITVDEEPDKDYYQTTYNKQ